jgi:formate hydrogenlyase transcriptional activator
MGNTYLIIAMLISGSSFSLGLISLFFGFQDKNHKEYIIFGIMSLCLTIFFLAPPLGFIIDDHAPYSLAIIVKRIFIYTYYILIPLFLIYYSGYKSKKVFYLTTGLAIIGYITMALTQDDSWTPVHFIVSMLVFGVITIFGFHVGFWQLRHGNKRSAYYLLITMMVFAALFTFLMIHQFIYQFDFPFADGKLFLPFHLNTVFFLIIIALQLYEKLFMKIKLEKLLNIRYDHWNAFMQKAPLIVLELDETGNILFINEHGLKTLGHETLLELKGKNWFDNFIENDQKLIKQLFNDVLQGKNNAPYHKNAIKSKDGQKRIISWVNYLTYLEETQSKVVMCVGKDITDEEVQTKLISELKQSIEKENIDFTIPQNLNNDEIIGNSHVIRYVLQKISMVAATQVPILIEGETGVGKELVAELIYKNSLRSDKPFIKVNCGALPKELIEDELFGHEKGAFTSAIQARKGRFELADGGTILLDEIGELPLEMQPKLLRVLQNGEFERVGGQKTIKVDVRLIAATNRNLNTEVQQGRFRGDLFYRLNVFPITIPPLRQRKDDLKELINYFIASKSMKYGKNLQQISRGDLQKLLDYPWPGNVRELKNVIERSVLASEGATLRLDWFWQMQNIGETQSNKSLEVIEKEYILKVMKDSQWKINGANGAAEKLAMHPNTLRSKMKKLGISRPENLKNTDQ